MAATEPFIGNLVSGTRGTWKNPTIVPVRMQHGGKNSFVFPTEYFLWNYIILPGLSGALFTSLFISVPLYNLWEMFCFWFVRAPRTPIFVSVSALALIFFLPLAVCKRPHLCPALRFFVAFIGFFLSLITCVLLYSSPVLQHTKPSRRGCVVSYCSLHRVGLGFFGFTLLFKFWRTWLFEFLSGHGWRFTLFLCWGSTTGVCPLQIVFLGHHLSTETSPVSHSHRSPMHSKTHKATISTRVECQLILIPDPALSAGDTNIKSTQALTSRGSHLVWRFHTLIRQLWFSDC